MFVFVLSATFNHEIPFWMPRAQLGFAGYSQIFGIFEAEKNETREPWEKLFYCCNRILLVGFPPQKISEYLFWGQNFSHDRCREVASGTVIKTDSMVCKKIK